MTERVFGETGLALRALEEWFTTVVTHPTSISDGLTSAERTVPFGLATLERVITAGPRLSALKRIAIYYVSYRARLVECLADDYPVLRHALGFEAFESLCHEYIAAYPSSSPNLNGFGRHMAAFCESRNVGFPLREFASDLAELEWALVEVLHAPHGSRLSIEALESSPRDAWAQMRFVRGPTVRLLHSRYPVNAYFQAFRRRDDDGPATIPDRRASATAVYRLDNVVWRMDLTIEAAALLSDLFEGHTLAAGLEKLERRTSDTDGLVHTAANVNAWFRDWVSGGFFARVSSDASSGCITTG
jgi:hypothetical protein